LTPEQARKELEEGVSAANKPPVDSEDKTPKPDENTPKPEEKTPKPEEPNQKPDAPEKPPAEGANKPVQAQEEKIETPEASKTSAPNPGPQKPSPPAALVKTPPPPAPYDVETHPNRDPLFNLQGRVAILHYGAIVKPWEKHVQGLRDMKKEWHPTIYEQFSHWRENANKFCPTVQRQKKDAPEGEMEPFHIVNNI